MGRKKLHDPYRHQMAWARLQQEAAKLADSELEELVEMIVRRKHGTS